VKAVCEELNVSERRACKVLGQYRSTQRYVATVESDEEALTGAIVELATRYGRYGYKRVTGLLREAGWKVGLGVSSFGPAKEFVLPVRVINKNTLPGRHRNSGMRSLVPTGIEKVSKCFLRTTRGY